MKLQRYSNLRHVKSKRYGDDCRELKVPVTSILSSRQKKIANLYDDDARPDFDVVDVGALVNLDH